MAKIRKSFYDWCIDNGKEEWLELWDYEKNGCSPKDVGYGSRNECWFKCERGLHKSEQKMISSLTNGHANINCRYCNSFEQWCIDNGKEHWLSLWDDELNKCSPRDISYAINKKYYFKCPRGLHNSEEKTINALTKKTGNTEFKCKYCNSYYQWCIDNNETEQLNSWDYELNKCSPKDINYSSNKKYYFKCPSGKHESEQNMINSLTSGHASFKCKWCNSFYNWCIDNKKEDWLDLWDYELNDCTPKDVPYSSGKKYFFKCPRGLHESEEKRIASLISKNTNLMCNCCNSIGQYLINNYGEDALEKFWDYKKNGSLDPFKITKCSAKKVWIKCQEDETHGSYFIRCTHFTSMGSRCPICKEKKGERKIREYLIKNNIEFEAQKTFPNLRGVGKQPLTFDFYIPFKNLLIEFQGEQHYRPVDFSGKDMNQAEEKFENQQEHDKRKREYAKQNNIHLLEITYLEEDLIEEILDKIFK